MSLYSLANLTLDWSNDYSPTTINAHESVVHTISLMNHSQQGCVLVLEGKRFAGTFTEQDLVRLIATNQKLDALKLIDVITRSPMTIKRSQASVAKILRLFEEHSLKYLPVLDEEEYPIALITAEHLIQIISRESALKLTDNEVTEVTTDPQQNQPELGLTDQRFAFALQNAPVVVFNQDRDLLYTWIYNPALGYKANEVVGKSDYEIMPTPEVAQQLTEIKKRVLTTGIRERHEIAIPVNKCTQYFDLTVEALTNVQGEITGVACAALDISNIKQIQVKLQDSQHFTQRIVDISPDIIYIYDLQEQRNVYVNNSITPILGYSIADIQAMGSSLFATIIHRDDLETVINSQKRFDTAKDGDILEIEYRIIDADGQCRWFYDRSAVFLRDAAGRVKQVVGNAQDIHKRKLAEEQIKSIEVQQSSILEHLPVGVVLSAGIEQRLLYQNPRFSELFGYTIADMLTIEKWELLAYPDPKYRAYINQEWRRRLETAIANQRDIEPLEASIQAKDGTVKYVRIHATIIGELNFITFIDLTDHHKVASELQESELHLHTIVSQSSDGIIILNQNGIIIFANPSAEKIFNLHIGELKGLELGIPITIGKSFEMDFVTETGKPKIAEVLVTQIEWDNELSYLTSIRDISDRKQVEEQLILANAELVRATRLKDEFLASMSHELRTPLNAILGMSESLLEGILGELNDRQRKSLETIERSGYHLLELINDILDLAKIESGKLELHLQDTSAQSICQDSLTFVRQLANKKNIQLITQLPSNPISICVDELRLRQALINLLTNAVKFTPDDGKVTLELQIITLGNIEASPNIYIEFAVIDTGIGIAPQDINKLFQTFVQIDSALNRKYAGTGLGLALVKRIAELHGGHVLLESQLDRGSKFIIRIPYQHHQSNLLPNPIGQANSESNSSVSNLETIQPISPLILIADDNDANISSVWDYLESHGYRLLAVKDGLKAVNAATDNKPDLVLMDIQMPEMDGLEAIKVIRKNPELQSMPIIALTALAMSGDRERCLQAGANEYLAKPIKLKQLVSTIQSLLSATIAS